MRTAATALVLVFVATAGESFAANPNGEICTNNADCSSGYCYPGPQAQKFCVHRDWNCAWPKQQGAAYGEIYRFERTINFCNTRGLQSHGIDNVEQFVLRRVDYSWNAEQGGWQFSFSCDEDGKNCSPSLGTTQGQNVEGSVKAPTTQGLIYCNHEMRVINQNPPDGDHRPTYGIRRTEPDGVTVWYKVPSRPTTQGGSSLALQVFVLSVLPEAFQQYRATGLCLDPRSY